MAMEGGKVEAARSFGIREITVGFLIPQEKERLHDLPSVKPLHGTAGR